MLGFKKHFNIAMEHEGLIIYRHQKSYKVTY